MIGRRAVSAALATALACLWVAAFREAGLSASVAESVSFRTSDGQVVNGVFFAPSAQGPGVVLLPMLNRSHLDWEIVAQRLADSGIAALAVDFRTLAAPASAEEGTRGGYSMFNLDAQAALAYLRTRREVRATAIGMAGASIGANVALIVASGDSGVRSVALLSPTMDYRGLRLDGVMRKLAPRPALLLASAEDGFAARTAQELATLDGGGADVRIQSGAGHGTIMLSKQPDLVSALVDWFNRTLL
jgi:dienelactone hydrolase